MGDFERSACCARGVNYVTYRIVSKLDETGQRKPMLLKLVEAILLTVILALVHHSGVVCLLALNLVPVRVHHSHPHPVYKGSVRKICCPRRHFKFHLNF